MIVRHIFLALSTGNPVFFTFQQSGDVFSFGIITQEIVTEDEPYGNNTEPREEIINKVKLGFPIYRPIMPEGKHGTLSRTKNVTLLSFDKKNVYYKPECLHNYCT